MDKELEEAQNLTKDDLLAKLKSGRPAALARHRPERFAELHRPTESTTISIDSSSFDSETRGITVSDSADVLVS
jgi:hypothetical protein